jgi:cytochrome c553
MLCVILMLAFVGVSSAQEQKVYVIGKGSALSGYNAYNETTGELIDYGAADTEGVFRIELKRSDLISDEVLMSIIEKALQEAISNIRIVAHPVWADSTEPDTEPDPEEWTPDKADAESFKTSCVNCHKTETEDKYLWDKFSTDSVTWTHATAPSDKGHRQHLENPDKVQECKACHKKPV